ncbi:ligase-associated DNA damage response endonuclease PdeM [Algihabitans albus]|uniref:ligase-associated DNA damage response endonuclease PdeM n=1 Tax=Algihabitans albus TaxID=2164067 RepID=UPI000E5D866C|nr:ligase-associated DNA damage response endonuclease PdeM [Algihabitans albus]
MFDRPRSQSDEVALLRVNGQSLQPLVSGALWWPSQATLIVADLHFEKGSSFAARGQFLPPYDTSTTLEKLEILVEKFCPNALIALGDSFHDRAAAERISQQDQARIRRLAAKLDWLWIAGNHDPDPPADWGGQVAVETTVGGLVFRHEALADRPDGELSGHFHPKACVQVRGKRVSARCFVSDGRRLILPSFGTYTGGLDVLDPAVSDLFPNSFTAHLLGKKALAAYPASALVGIVG